MAKKHKSKRITARQRYSIEKKVREHQRKVRKELREASKNGRTRKSAKKPIGIPNSVPFKEEILMEVERRKMDIENDKLRAKQRLKQLNAQKKLNTSAGLSSSTTSEFSDLAQMAQNAENRSLEFEENQMEQLISSDDPYVEKNMNANMPTDNSFKSFNKHLKSLIETTDVLLEVLDGRDPLGCRHYPTEQLIKKSGKRLIMVINKTDLVPDEVTEKWVKYLKNECPVIKFKASTQKQKRNIGQLSSDSVSSKELSQAIGTPELLSLLKSISAKFRRPITCGVFGLPNTGKSSLINSMCRKKSCQVGPLAGVTRDLGMVNLDSSIKLVDCPGIVFDALQKSQNQSPKVVQTSLNTEAALNLTESRPAQLNLVTLSILKRSINLQQLPDPRLILSNLLDILMLIPRSQLEKRFSLLPTPNSNDLLVQLARKLGRLMRGGICDYEGTSKHILEDLDSWFRWWIKAPEGKYEGIENVEHVENWGEEYKF